MTLISRIFYFQIIPAVLNLQASIRVVVNFRRLKLGMQIIVFQWSKVVVHRIAAHFWRVDLNWDSHIIVSLYTLSLVLVQPRKTRPCLTERLWMGRKESNQTNKQNCDLFLFTETQMNTRILFHLTLTGFWIKLVRE